jgi:hypothetical protein
VEDAVYICSWSRTSAGFTLWVKSRPDVQASAASYAEAEQRLIEAIQNSGGAMHAVLEFDPPLPKSTLEEKYSSPEIYLIGGDERFETDTPRWKWSESKQEVEDRHRWLNSFYNEPVCRKCKFTHSRRSNIPITLTYTGKYDGAFGSFGSDGGPNHQIVSEEFIELLGEEEKRCLEFQPTIRKGRKKFFELVGPEGPPLVAVAGLMISGWRCAQCEYRTWGYWVKGMSINDFVAKSDLSTGKSSVFTVGKFPEIYLAVTAARWKELLGMKGTRGFTSRLLGVAPDHEVIRSPRLPTMEEQPRWSGG